MDKRIEEAIRSEEIRQEDNIELIASENFVSNDIRRANGSVLTNKYAEGYPSKRYYGGCENVDIIENIAIEYARELFKCEYANVQPHDGSGANMAVYKALLDYGDKVMGMDLNAGGHLTHGYKLSFSGIEYDSVSYGVDSETERLNYDEIYRIASIEKPKMIIAGASAYPREIDFKKFREICDAVGSYLFVDMAHIAGLVAANLHQSPIPYADVVSSTTHKTLRGPRGGIILTNNEDIFKKINKAVFPETQGGPLEHTIAAKAQCFYEALQDDFKDYQLQVLKNIKAMCEEFKNMGYRIVSGGTDNHLMLLDVKSSVGITGKKAENILGRVNITVNKNTIPNDTEKPFVTSGIRIGSPAMTSRGLKEDDFIEIARIIDCAFRENESEQILKERVKRITKEHPLWY